MEIKKEIPIFFATDDTYIPYLAVALESIKQNSSRNYTYLIKVLYTNINDQNKNEILKYSDDNYNIEFVNVTTHLKEINNSLYTRDYYSKAIYYRLLIPNLYPQYDKCLYLDCDIVVLGDISELYNHNLRNNLLGAIPDEAVLNIKPFQDYVENRIAVDKYYKYFNSGILVMNLKMLRETKCFQLFIDLLLNVRFEVAPDQDYLNIICKNRVLYIDSTWDKMPFPSNIKEENINLIHYNLTSKPWHYDNILYEDYFWNFAKKTNYYQTILDTKKNYSSENKIKDAQCGESLVKLAATQAGETEVNSKIQLIIEACKNKVK